MSVERIGKKWRAKGYFMGRSVHLGMYSTKKQAEHAVEEAQREFINTKWDLGLIELGKKSSLWIRIKRWLKR